MTIRQWLTDKGIPHGKVLIVHPATDGFKKDRDNILSISITGCWPGADFGTAFVAGADADKVKDITGVSVDDYERNALPLNTVEEQITPLVEDADFLVIWYAQYSKSWLEYVLPDLFIGKEMLDAAPLVKALEQKMELPVDDLTVSELSERMRKATFQVKGGYKFEEVCARIIPGIDGDTPDAYLTGSTPKLERTVYMLQALWSAILDR